VDNFCFISGGKPTKNANELLGNGRLKLLLERMASTFDWIIIDSPPFLPISDAKLMAELCDGVLIVVRVGATPFDVAQRAYWELREMRFLGIVLNHVDPRSIYGDYYRYYGNRDNSARRKGRKTTPKGAPPSIFQQ
jgi:protein-tyrosine kinase